MASLPREFIPLPPPYEHYIYGYNPTFTSDQILGESHPNSLKAHRMCDRIQVLQINNNLTNDSLMFYCPEDDGQQGFNHGWAALRGWTSTVNWPDRGKHNMTFLVISRDFLLNDPTKQKLQTYINMHNPTVAIVVETPEDHNVILDMSRFYDKTVRLQNMGGVFQFDVRFYYNRNIVNVTATRKQGYNEFTIQRL